MIKDVAVLIFNYQWLYFISSYFKVELNYAKN
jgi:hypothetical protein